MTVLSLLYTPGNEPSKVAKAGTYGADAVVLDLEDAVPLDLEDAVPLDQKEYARSAVRQAIPAVKARALPPPWEPRARNRLACRIKERQLGDPSWPDAHGAQAEAWQRVYPCGRVAL